MYWIARQLLRNILLCTFILVCIPAFAQNSASTVVVVNTQVSETAISLGAARTMFGMRLQTWPDGVQVKVYVLRDDSPVHIDFSKQVLGIFPHQLRRAWDRLVFSGTGQEPIQVKSEEEMRQKVASTPGAIGYLSRSQVDASVNELQIK